MGWWIFWIVVAGLVFGGGSGGRQTADEPGAGRYSKDGRDLESDFDYCVRTTPGYRRSICDGDSKQVRERQRRDLDAGNGQ